MKVIVTGGAGFIGSNIVDMLLEYEHEVVIIDNLSTGKEENINSKAVFFNVDIRDAENLSKVFASVEADVVIHHAAQISVQKSLENPMLDAQINIDGTINVLNQCVKYNIKKIIYASSAAVYGIPQYLSIDEEHSISPISFYGISKQVPEEYIKLYSSLYGIKFTILRYANVYGIRQDPQGEGGVIPIFINELLRKNTPIIYGEGNQTRDFVFVKDVASANLAALENADNMIINIGTDREVSINKFYELLASLLNSDATPNYREHRTGDIVRSALTNLKAAEHLGWRPTYSFEDGLRYTLKYYQKELAYVHNN
ncbi:SDR family NAD(P)-dependent oxidoreductase [Paenibacillus glacialis]|uniref:UDP-glucose 4-epimerase n=1 Tax=Paenibacillus glacialis TaxID=494026 RepID=A0A162Q6F6_9BACL|nr:SDR family NAD(P)-dependent oxidoreductase [Paenibacillus glacialis]OAB42990.1 UDP-glucose 4-epimerase [Paenibacillus glacialis]